MLQKVAPKPHRKFLYASLLGLIFASVWVLKRSAELEPKSSYPIEKADLALALAPSLSVNQFPETIEIEKGRKKYSGTVRYSLDLVLQNKMEKMFQSYKPDYGAFVALDAKTGAVLSLVSYTAKESKIGNLNLRASFPAASVFKIVTSAVALEQASLKPESVISFNGANHTLYKRNVTSQKVNRWTRHMTLKEAFAKSINTVFGRLGAFVVKPNDLEAYAKRFLFNQGIPADIPVESGKFNVNAEDEYALAEAASGYNRIAQMSPLQGALIAAAVVNEGILMEPYLVESVTTNEKGPIYHAEPRVFSQVVGEGAARELRELMHETVRNGTSRNSFRDYLRKTTQIDLEVGGKTGSLTGLNPKGKYDWFVGYASLAERRIAVAALTINEDTWKVKASRVARTFIESTFQAPKTRGIARSR